MIRSTLASLTVLVLLTNGCKSAYYNTWEKLGWDKRHILVDRVQDAKTDQEAAKEQFKTTLERFQELTNFHGGELEVKYRKFSRDFEDCKDRADALSERVSSVNTVATDLFAEWREELNSYEDSKLRRSSEDQLRQTEERYAQLFKAMTKSEQSMKPVLSAFNDQVLFLKHNLNSQAISSLQGTASEIEANVGALIKQMEASIDEANAFISQMKS